MASRVKFRVAFLVPSLTGGGAERATADLASALDPERFDVSLFVERSQHRRYDVDREVKVIELGARNTRGALLPLVKAIKRTSPDVLYTALPHLGGLGWLAARLAKNRPAVVTSVHNNLEQEFNDLGDGRIWRRLMPLLFRRIDHIVTVSEGVADQVVSLYGADRRHVSVIPNIVDRARVLRMADDESLIECRRARRLVVVGRLVPQKNIDDAIRVFSEVAKKFADVELWILGDGPEREHLEMVVKQLGLSGRVRFFGAVDNPFRLMRGADALLLTSRYEGFGLVLVEAMTLGVPTVSYDCKFGPSEVTKNGQAGILVAEGNVRAMVSGVERLLADARESDSVTERGRLRAQHYDPQRVAVMAETLFLSLIAGRADSAKR